MRLERGDAGAESRPSWTGAGVPGLAVCHDLRLPTRSELCGLGAVGESLGAEGGLAGRREQTSHVR